MQQDEISPQDIIEMARQAGFTVGYGSPALSKHEAFAKLVEAHTRGQLFKPDWDNYRQGLIDGATAEREACDQLVNDDSMLSDNDAIRLSRAIRARGEA